MKKTKQKHYGGSLAVPDKEVAQLIDAIMNKRECKRKSKFFYFCRIRDSMAIIFHSFLGVRQRNVLEVSMGEINLRSRKLYIPSHKSKSGEQEYLTIPRAIISQLKFYIAIKKRMFPKSEWLFPGCINHGKFHLDSNSYMRMFRDALKLAGLYHVNYIDKQGHKRASKTTHGLRKGSATKVWLVTGDMVKVAIHLMHTDERMRSTFRYIKAAKEEVREQICDMVFDEVWRDPAIIHAQKEKLIQLLQLQQNKHIPIVKF